MWITFLGGQTLFCPATLCACQSPVAPPPAKRASPPAILERRFRANSIVFLPPFHTQTVYVQQEREATRRKKQRPGEIALTGPKSKSRVSQGFAGSAGFASLVGIEATSGALVFAELALAVLAASLLKCVR